MEDVTKYGKHESGEEARAVRVRLDGMSESVRGLVRAVTELQQLTPGWIVEDVQRACRDLQGRVAGLEERLSALEAGRR